MEKEKQKVWPPAALKAIQVLWFHAHELQPPTHRELCKACGHFFEAPVFENIEWFEENDLRTVMIQICEQCVLYKADLANVLMGRDWQMGGEN